MVLSSAGSGMVETSWRQPNTSPSPVVAVRSVGSIRATRRPSAIGPHRSAIAWKIRPKPPVRG